MCQMSWIRHYPRFLWQTELANADGACVTDNTTHRKDDLIYEAMNKARASVSLVLAPKLTSKSTEAKLTSPTCSERTRQQTFVLPLTVHTVSNTGRRIPRGQGSEIHSECAKTPLAMRRTARRKAPFAQNCAHIAQTTFSPCNWPWRNNSKKMLTKRDWIISAGSWCRIWEKYNRIG